MTPANIISQGNNLKTLDLFAKQGKYLDESAEGFCNLSVIEKLFRTVMSYLCCCFNCVDSYQSAALTYSLKTLQIAYYKLDKFEADSKLAFVTDDLIERTESQTLIIDSILSRCERLSTISAALLYPFLTPTSPVSIRLLDGSSLSVEVDLNKTTVGTLKRDIQEKTYIAVADQRLTLNNKELHDEQSLSNFNLKLDIQIHLTKK